MARDDRRSPEAEAYRSWYKTARWQKLRQEVLIRDAYTCQRTGQLCSGKHPAPNSPTVNHRIPHKGDPALFWDPDNLQCITKAEHDSIVQAEEKRGHVIGCDETGRPLDPSHPWNREPQV